MSATQTILITLLGLGSVQGLVYGVILLRSTRENKLANRLLAAILFFFSYRLLVQILRLFGLGYYDIWYYFMLDYSWVHGPLLYFYVKAHLIPNFKLRTRDLAHFIPLFLQIGFSIFVRLQNLYWDGTKESLSWLGYWGYVVWMNLSTIYFVASVLIIIYSFQAQRLLKLHQSDFRIAVAGTNWLSKVLMAFKFYFALVLLTLIVDVLIIKNANFLSYWYFDRFYYYPFFLGISALTYWLGLEGYKRKDTKIVDWKPNISSSEMEVLNTLAIALEAAMQEHQWYKDPELTLPILASKLDTKPYLLTKCLNTILQNKFADYINSYRVSELKRLLDQPENDKYTLLSLAYDAGFNSKSSFHRAVKKHLGVNPGDLKSS
ncbi:MAG: helix-turn-helix domain-containing protein [Bacteroidota bacterium]